jgi:hypothetical protein
MASSPSLRRLWAMYKRIASSDGSHSKRDLLVAQAAFYASARGIGRVLARLLERGDYEELHSVIKSHNRLVTKLQERRLRARAH